jgi:hypothetical protein
MQEFIAKHQDRSPPHSQDLTAWYASPVVRTPWLRLRKLPSGAPEAVWNPVVGLAGVQILSKIWLNQR